MGILMGCALISSAANARANDPTKEQCIGANEGAQALRPTGKLQATRALLLICISKNCPGPVRDDCTERLNDLEKAIPTIVFAAKVDGNDISAVKVTMDGTSVAERLDGSPVVVEPGEHIFAFTTTGYPTVSKKLVIHEGERSRAESVIFGTPPAAAPATPSAPPPAAAAEKPTPASSGSSRQTIAYVLGGAGIVGIGVGSVFGLLAKSTYDDALKKCNPQFACNPAGFSGGEDAHTQATVSTVAFIAGGALLAGGVVVYFTAPKDRAVSVQTTAGADQLGFRIGGSW